MLVSTTGSSQLVHGEERGRGLRTHLYSQVTTQGMKWNEGQKEKEQKTQKSLQSDDLPSLQRGAEFKLRTPKLRIQKKKKKKS